MERIAVDPLQVVLVGGARGGGSNDARGKLLEAFVARLLHTLGYEAPTTSDLNVTSGGIELDVVTRHRLTGANLIAECKAYSTNVPAEMVDTFLGKLVRERYDDPDLQGLFVALPRLTGPGEEQARSIERRDSSFQYLNANSIADQLRNADLLVDPPPDSGILSDPMVILSEHGIYQASMRLDPASRTADALVLWSAQGSVAEPALALVRQHSISNGLPVLALGQPSQVRITGDDPVIAHVAASTGDFHYQLPAAPKYFVGRRVLLGEVRATLSDPSPSVLVFNAQSGWGKSSLALRVGKVVEEAKGRAMIVDVRTASSPSFVPAALHALAVEAARRRILQLPEDAAFGTTSSSLRSFETASWAEPRRPLMVFFDQFENVFRDTTLTRAFRDLALAVSDLTCPLNVGFAWKTDLVGWTEGHPYQLRDEIRSVATVVTLPPFGATEISTLLTRLQKATGQKLHRDLRDRLREYSGGLPWLFKKLASHIIDELAAGATQADLLAEALNVRNLFDSDLAELGPAEAEALRDIARLAPVPISELTDTVESDIIQALLDRRLIVQVGERLDIYWDIFRDYLNTGVVPIKEAFILRLSPSPSMGTLLRTAIENGGTITTGEAMAVLGTSEAVVFNTVRELRLLGLVSYTPGEIHIAPSAMGSNPEAALRQIAASALRRHLAYDLMVDLLQETGIVSYDFFAECLSVAFPAVTAKASTWDQYARAFAYWFAYAGLFGFTTWGMSEYPEDTHVDLAILSRQRRLTIHDRFPQSAAGPAIELGCALSEGNHLAMSASRRKKALGALRALSLARTDHNGVEVVDELVFRSGQVDRPALRRRVEERVPGGPEALEALSRDPSLSAIEVGLLLKDAQGATWARSTTEKAGKHFRSWAREAGLRTSRPSRADQTHSPYLFDDHQPVRDQSRDRSDD